MNYIEKLFKQHPFIYHIGGKYYAFGAYVCYECDMHSITLESRYKEYEESMSMELSDKEAWRIFHRLIFRAECVRNERGYCNKPQDEILKFQFSDEEMEQLKLQVDNYITYWKKYSLSSFV